MNKLLLPMVGLLCSGVVWLTLHTSEPAMAISGCCKQRASIDDPWSDLGKSFDRCELMNEEEDGGDDDIFKAKGKVWWDIAC